MDIILDRSRLEKLLQSLYSVTGLKFCVCNTNFREIYSAAEQTSFCNLIKHTEFGLSKCLACDADAFKIAKVKGGPYIYRCHAGILEACSPVIENGEVIAYFMYGQILDDTPYEAQWEQARQKCLWHHDIGLLKKYFFQLRRVSIQTQRACAEIMSACTSYIWLKSMEKTYHRSDAQRLIFYIHQNYDKNLSLESVAGDLNMSKTKLCTMAKAQLGHTVGELISRKRIEVAKNLLQTTDLFVSEISTRIGISDYNYFSRLFKMKEGATPSEFRSRHRLEAR